MSKEVDALAHISGCEGVTPSIRQSAGSFLDKYLSVTTIACSNDRTTSEVSHGP